MSASHRVPRWPAVLLLPLCAALYLPGLFVLPPIDRDESRYAQAARQMAASGEAIVPRVQGATRLIKPIGIYWLQLASLRLAGGRAPGAIGIHRLPSVLGAVVAVVATYGIGRCWFPARVAWLGAAWLAASALLVVEAHLATTDAVLLGCVVVAQGCLARLMAAARRERPGSRRAAAGFWIAQAAGVLVKGPVAPLVSALTIAALAIGDRAGTARLLRALRPQWGMPLFAACVIPWIAAVGLAAGWRALPDAMASDLVPKLTGAHESHGGPPGFYLALTALTFWPGSLALLFALVMAWRRRRRDAERFLLAWLIPTWLCFECLPTKLPNYVLPTFPALALLAARAALSAPTRLRPPLKGIAVRVGCIGWALLTLALGLTPLAAALWFRSGPAGAAGGLTASAAVIIAGVFLRSCRKGNLAPAAWTAALVAAAVYAPLLQWTLSDLDALWLSRDAAAAVARAGAARPLAAVGYAEPSLLFLTRSDVALLDPDAAALLLAEHPDALVLVANDQIAAFASAARRRSVSLRNLWATRGINYSNGQPTELQLFERAESLTHQNGQPGSFN